MITEISIEDIKHYKVGDDNKTSLPNLSRVNIFVGPNNSGKSYFMRRLFAIKRLNYNNNDMKIEYWNKILKEYILKINSCISKYPNSLSALNERVKKISPIRYINQEYNSNLKNLLNAITDLCSSLKSTNYNNKYELLAVVEELMEQLVNAPLDMYVQYNQYYIPMLRGLRPIQYGVQGGFDGKRDSYKERTLSDYSWTEKDFRDRIFTGLNF